MDRPFSRHVRKHDGTGAETGGPSSRTPEPTRPSRVGPVLPVRSATKPDSAAHVSNHPPRRLVPVHSRPSAARPAVGCRTNEAPRPHSSGELPPPLRRSRPRAAAPTQPGGRRWSPTPMAALAGPACLPFLAPTPTVLLPPSLLRPLPLSSLHPFGSLLHPPYPSSTVPPSIRTRRIQQQQCLLESGSKMRRTSLSLSLTRRAMRRKKSKLPKGLAVPPNAPPTHGGRQYQATGLLVPTWSST